MPLISKVKGDLERGHEPASDTLCPHGSSPWDGRTFGHSIWGMLLYSVFRVPFFRYGEKWLEVVSKVDIWHILGPQSHVSLATLVVLLLDTVMQI